MFSKSFSRVILATVLSFSNITTFGHINQSTIETTYVKTEYKPAIQIGNLYYYNQLNNEEKRIYNELIKNTKSFLNYEDITLVISTYDEENKKGLTEYYYFVKRVIKAYTYDNPEAVVWFENYDRTYYISDQKDYVYMHLIPKSSKSATSSLNANNVKTELNTLQNKAQQFVQKLTGTDSEKLLQIYNWVIANASYDMTISLPDRDNIYGALIKGKAICSGYSYAFKYVADLAGLNVIYVVGKVYDENTGQYMPHAWNLAYVDGRWLLVDVTHGRTGSTKYRLVNPNNKIHYPEKSYGFTYPK